MENKLKTVVDAYYNCIKAGRMKLEEVPDRYRKQVEVYYNEMEKTDNAHS